LSGNFSAFNPAYRSAVAHAAKTLVSHGATPAHANAFAPGLLYQQLVSQSEALGFLDAFRMMAMVSFAALPLLLLLKRSRSQATVSVH